MTRFFPATRARLLALLLGLAGSAACAAATSPLDIQSARAAAMVMTALVNDPQIGTRPIDVRVTDGVVRLSGRVASAAEVARAVAIARAVPGVTRVDANLRVSADLPADAGVPQAARQRPPDPAAEFAELEDARSRFGVGASFGSSHPTGDGLGTAWSIGPLLRFGSGPGLGPAVGFDWYRMSVASGDPGAPSSRLRVRPLMVGLAYTVRSGPVSVSPSLVGGYSFNGVSVSGAGAPAGRLAVDVSNGLAWRPGVSVWIDTGRRTAANISLGQVRTRLKVTFIEDGRVDTRTLAGHATMVSIGFAYTVF